MQNHFKKNTIENLLIGKLEYYNLGFSSLKKVYKLNFKKGLLLK